MVTDGQRREAARYLFGSHADDDDTPRLRDEVVAAITTDDFGPVPTDLTCQETWAQITDHDRDEILRFRAFLSVAGPPPLRLAEPQ